MSDTETNSKSTGLNPMHLIAIIALLAVTGGYYFMSANKNNAPVNTEGTKIEETTESPMQQATENPVKKGSTGPSSADTTNTTASNVKTINIEAGSFYFKPNKITVKKGDTVKIVFKAVDMIHNFYLDVFNVKGPTVKAGNTDTVQFTADKTGSFEFYCNVGSHRTNGQVGTLAVE